MKKEIFRYFLRKTYPYFEVSNEDCDDICDEFINYLNNKCKPETLKNFMPKDALEVIMNDEHPLRHHGFHPAFVLHFEEFVKIVQESQK